MGSPQQVSANKTMTEQSIFSPKEPPKSATGNRQNTSAYQQMKKRVDRYAQKTGEFSMKNITNRSISPPDELKTLGGTKSKIALISEQECLNNWVALAKHIISILNEIKEIIKAKADDLKH